MDNKTMVCTIGGGTGTSVVAAAIKDIDHVELKAIVSVSDNGGSTGRLRDEFGFLPVGDLRQALAAMATNKKNDWIRKLLLYRFEKGSGLEGHNLGNLILTVLQDMTGSTESALEVASSIFRLHGTVLPITNNDTQIETQYEDGTTLIGEKNLDENRNGKKIVGIKLIPKATINKKSKEAIIGADFIIIGPGDLFASILANLVVSGAKDAFKKSKAKIIYVMSLMTKYTQTNGLTASEHLKVIEREIGKKVDYILLNDENIPKNILAMYAKDMDFPVVDDLNGDSRIIRAKLIKPVKVVQSKKDVVSRSYLRHDSDKLKEVFSKICHKKS